MAVQRGDAKQGVLIYDEESGFGQDPDSGETYAASVLMEVTRGSGFPTDESVVRAGDRVQMDQAINKRSVIVGREGKIDFATELLLAPDSPDTVGQQPNGGPYRAPLRAAWGIPQTQANAAKTGTMSGGTSSVPIHTDAAAADIGVGDICIFTDEGSGIFDVRQIWALAVNDMTLNRALSFTPANLDKVIPLETWAPAKQIGKAITGTLKWYNPARSPLAGARVFSYGCALTAELEGLTARGMPLLRFAGTADNWEHKTPTLPAISELRMDTAPPVVVGSKFFLGSATSRQIGDLGVKTGLALHMDPSTEGLQGRAAPFRFMDSDPEITIKTPHDAALYAQWESDAVDTALKYAEFHCGKNSRGTTVDARTGFFVVMAPAVEIRGLKKTTHEEQIMTELTLGCVENPSYPDLANLYIAFPG